VQEIGTHEARIMLEGPGGLKLDWAAGIRRADMRRIMLETERERVRLIEMWREIHG
jgi:hypothetical protein